VQLQPTASEAQTPTLQQQDTVLPVLEAQTPTLQQLDTALPLLAHIRVTWRTRLSKYPVSRIIWKNLLIQNSPTVDSDRSNAGRGSITHDKHAHATGDHAKHGVHTNPISSVGGAGAGVGAAGIAEQ